MTKLFKWLSAVTLAAAMATTMAVSATSENELMTIPNGSTPLGMVYSILKIWKFIF